MAIASCDLALEAQRPGDHPVGDAHVGGAAAALVRGQRQAELGDGLVVPAGQVVGVAQVVAQRPFPLLRLFLGRGLHVGQRLLVPGELGGRLRVDHVHHVQRVDREVVEPGGLRLLERLGVGRSRLLPRLGRDLLRARARGTRRCGPARGSSAPAAAPRRARRRLDAGEDPARLGELVGACRRCGRSASAARARRRCSRPRAPGESAARCLRGPSSSRVVRRPVPWRLVLRAGSMRAAGRGRAGTMAERDSPKKRCARLHLHLPSIARSRISGTESRLPPAFGARQSGTPFSATVAASCSERPARGVSSGTPWRAIRRRLPSLAAIARAIVCASIRNGALEAGASRRDGGRRQRGGDRGLRFRKGRRHGDARPDRRGAAPLHRRRRRRLCAGQRLQWAADAAGTR